jgi:endonuclease YncB( thermonuclease family)
MAGKEATAAMLELVRGRTVTCEPKAKDRYGRTVSLCRADGADLGAAMVSAGMAWPFTRYSSDYVSHERAAIGAGTGVHAHDCAKPWDWRERKRATGRSADRDVPASGSARSDESSDSAVHGGPR